VLEVRHKQHPANPAKKPCPPISRLHGLASARIGKIMRAGASGPQLFPLLSLELMMPNHRGDRIKSTSPSFSA
jgi:hypothetical protein